MLNEYNYIFDFLIFKFFNEVLSESDLFGFFLRVKFIFCIINYLTRIIHVI